MFWLIYFITLLFETMVVLVRGISHLIGRPDSALLAPNGPRLDVSSSFLLLIVERRRHEQPWQVDHLRVPARRCQRRQTGWGRSQVRDESGRVGVLLPARRALRHAALLGLAQSGVDLEGVVRRGRVVVLSLVRDAVAVVGRGGSYRFSHVPVFNAGVAVEAMGRPNVVAPMF